MRDAETVLAIIRDRGERGLPLENLYRQLFNPELYLRAYGRISGAQVLLPDEPEREAVHRAYVEMAVPGRVTPAQRDVFFAAGRALAARGAEAIILGGTDLFLAFDGEACGFATIDCARVHVEVILAREGPTTRHQKSAATSS